MIEIAHIHPMLVHFPIVFWLTAVTLQAIILIKGGDLTQRQCLSQVAVGALMLGTLAGIAAATFGDIALDHAAALGFPKATMEAHETMATITLWLFIGLAALHAFFFWRQTALTKKFAWGLLAVGVIGIFLVLITAYLGGNLVYHLGVNVHAVTPAAGS